MEGDNKIQQKSVETYAEDIASAVGTNEEGLIKKIIEEEERKEAEKIRMSPQHRQNRQFMFASVLLIIFAVAGVFTFIYFRKSIDTVEVAPQFVPIIFTDSTEFVEVAGLAPEDIGSAINDKAQEISVRIGKVAGIYLTENKEGVGLKKFIALLDINFSLAGMDFLYDNFFLGVMGRGTDSRAVGKDPFMLFKVHSFAEIFQPMRDWERSMFSDVRRIFGIDLSTETSYLLSKNFEDSIVENKNARILYDNAGNIVLMYVFADDTSIIITASTTAVREVLLRLAAGDIRR